MKLPDVQEVFEARSVAECNDALSQGWQLLAILASRSPRHAATYVLGARTHTDALTAVPTLSASYNNQLQTPEGSSGRPG